jgi:hypothetical protein
MRGQDKRVRRRFFLAVEGRSEQAFTTWLQRLADGEGLNIHLDSNSVGGGGYRSMLKEACRLHDRGKRTKGRYYRRFLIVDGDRSQQGDWSIPDLRQRALEQGILVCVQKPNHEAFLLRLAGWAGSIPDAAAAKARLKMEWPAYEKPMIARDLEVRFDLWDLLRVAGADSDLRTLLQAIGFLST